MKRLHWIFALFLITGLLAGCAAPTLPTSAAKMTETPTLAPTEAAIPPASTATPREAGDPQAPFMPAVQKFALDKFNALPAEVRVIKMEPVEWPDACLGAAQPGEICAAMITPGYRLQVEIKGKVYELHSDSGKFVRMPAATPAPTPANVEINPAAEAARLWLMDKLKVDSSAIRVVSVSEQDWPDGCLGVHKPGIMCTSVIVPGYRVILEAGKDSYELRTNRDGKAIVLADPMYQLSNPKNAGLAQPQISWKSGDAGCLMLQAANDQAAFGTCGGMLQKAALNNPERIKELDALLRAYLPFYGQTTAGEVTFYGGGSKAATPSQQRALAEWARMVYLEVSSKTTTANNGLAFTWRRTGGIAGFCDELKIYRSGLATNTDCRGNNPKITLTKWLTIDQLNRLYTWLDELKTSDGKISDDGAVADGMTFTWVLSGTGPRAMTAKERLAMQDFGIEVYNAK